MFGLWLMAYGYMFLVFKIEMVREKCEQKGGFGKIG